MTMEDFKEMKSVEIKKLEALEKIIAILEQLEEDTDSDAVEWVLEKAAE